MAKKFSKEAWVLLSLIVLMGIVFTYYSIKQNRSIDEVISITDGRTEYLHDQVEDLENRVNRLELTR